MKTPVSKKHRDGKGGGVKSKNGVGHGSKAQTGGKSSMAQKPNPSTGRKNAVA